jgi:hypothetical protein
VGRTAGMVSEHLLHAMMVEAAGVELVLSIENT